MSGIRLAALYGLIPNQLGFCGPKQQILKNFIRRKISAKQAQAVLKKFEAAYSYYQLIAQSNKIKNPFDKNVVEAYWLGNNLLEKVKTNDLRQMIIKNFSRRPRLLSKEVAIKKAREIPKNSKPHHSFHVLIIGSITGRVNFEGDTELKDVCRVGWGKVTKIVIPAKAGIQKFGSRIPPSLKLCRAGKCGTTNKTVKIIVEYQPLVGNKKIILGKPIKKEVIWDKNLIPKIKIGDWVSFHWDWLVKVLNADELINLRKYTQNTLSALK